MLKLKDLRSPSLGMTALAILSISWGASASAQTPTASDASGKLVQSWSSSKVLFTGNGKPEQIARVQNDPRYQFSQMLRVPGLLHAGRRATAASSTPVDWAVSLGPKTTSRGTPEGEFPAKFTTNAFAPLTFPDSCNNDFIVYTIATPGVTMPAPGTQANIVGLNNLYTGSVASS